MKQCWQVELRYDTEGGTQKRMRTRLMTYSRAVEYLRYYERRGVLGRLVEDKDATAEQLAAIKPASGWEHAGPASGSVAS